MPKNPLNRFFLYIVLPSILAIVFFILSIFLVILPSVEKNSMEGKREMISELTNTAWSLLEEYHHEAENNILPEDSAKIMAAEKIGKIRYGDQGKDYFWIIDKHPFMIMHPYRPELILKDLNNYQDPEGKLLFVEATKTVTETGSGYIYYLWQWKDDSTRVVPKLSFVKEFQPWGWIIGTGIYLDDVHQEIKVLKNKLLRIVLLITLVIILLLALIIRQSLGIEKKREEAENKLKLSRQKYKSLVEASTEGTLMILKDEIIFSNLKFSDLSGYDPFEMAKLNFGDIFAIKWEHLLSSFSDPTKSVTQETTLICKDGKKPDVVISASMVPYSGEKGYVLIVKEVKPQQMLGKEIETLTEELQTSLLSMNQLIKPFVRELKKCPADKSIREAAVLMTRKNTRIIFISQGESIIGVVNSNDLKNRVLAKGIDPERPVIEIMTAPVESISEKALLHEALLKLKNKQVSHLAILNEKQILNGVIGYEDIIDIQHNTLGYFIKEIETAGDIHQLSKIYGRLPVLVKSLLESGDKTAIITRIISSVADAMHKRIIGFATEEIGPPPCPFAFMVMGSEGRREQTLATDQDNAIVFADVDEKEYGTVQKYFLSMGEFVNKGLHTVGYQYCKGEVMARNPKWTQALTTWKKYFTDWINNSNPQDVMEAGIFFDFRCVYGEESLVASLREHVNTVSGNKAVFFYHMAQSVMKFKPPLNMFGNIVGEEPAENGLHLDIKKVLFPVTTCIRLYSIREKLTETNSLERLDQLYSREILDKTSYEDLGQAYNFMTSLRLRFQVESIMENEPPGNNVNLDKLTRMDVMILKKFFS